MLSGENRFPSEKLGRHQSAGGRLDLNVDTGREAQFIQRFDRLGRSLDDVNQTLVRPDLILLTSFLVDKRARQDRIPLDPRWQRDRAVHDTRRRFHGVNDLLGTLIQNSVIVRFQSNADDFAGTS